MPLTLVLGRIPLMLTAVTLSLLCCVINANQTEERERPSQKKTRVPIWGIVTIVFLLMISVCIFILVFCSTDKDGRISLPCFRNQVGHVKMTELRLGKLEKQHSERSLAETLKTQDVTVRPEHEKAVVNTENSVHQQTSQPIEFASAYETHEITMIDPGRCANPHKHSDCSGNKSSRLPFNIY